MQESFKIPSATFPTLTGSIVTFNSQYALPLKSHKVAVTATQSGSGTPSPSNPRAISGLGAINIRATGTNLWGGEIIADDIQSVVSSAKKDTINKTVTYGAGSSSGMIFFKKFKPNTQYTVVLTASNSLNLTTNNLYVRYTDNTVKAVNRTQSIANVKETVVYVTTAGKSVKDIEGVNGGGFTTIYYDESGIFEGVKTIDDFVAYNGQNVTIQIGSTVYGGEYDARTGVLTVTHKGGVFDGSESWTYWTDSGAFFLNDTLDVDDTFRTGNVCLCNWLEESSSISNSSAMLRKPDLIFCNQTSFPQRLWVKMTQFTTETDFKNYLSSNNLVIVYPLSTPQSIQLVPCPIDTLQGVNNIWADTGDTTLQYPKFG